jgi:hypothetical protein
MPEGLRNAGPTFSRMIDEVFDKHKGKNLVAYVDDIVVKSDKKETHIQGPLRNIQESEKEQPQAKPRQMYIWHQERQIARLFSISERHRGKPQEDNNDSQHETTYKQKAGAEAHWQVSSTE